MAVGISTYTANAVLNALARNVSFTVATLYVKLHTANPGSAGTTSPAGNTTRKAATFGTSPSAGSLSNTTSVDWTTGEVNTAETYTHFSLWDASTAGNFLGSGTITANAVAVGDTFSLGVGSLTLSFPTAS